MIEKIVANKTKSNVEIYDKINIILNKPDDKKRKIMLFDICYIFDFMINLVAFIRLRRKKIFFDNMRIRLYADKKKLHESNIAQS